LRTFTLLGLLLVAICVALDNWETEEIDWSYRTNIGNWQLGIYQNSLVLDSNRNPHAAYIKITEYDDFPRCEIWYCNAYGDFDKECVGYILAYTGTLNPVYIPDISLVLDSSGNPHIFVATYYDNDEGSVFHYYKSGGNWQREVIDTHYNGTPTNANTTIRISAKQDSQGHFHVVYSMNWPSPGDGYRIRYATNKSGSWVVTDAYHHIGYYPVTGCDMEDCLSDQPMISFVEKSTYNTLKIWYTWYEEHIDEHSGQLVHTWNPSIIDELTSDSAISVLGETQLEIDSDNQSVVTYFLSITSVYNNRFMIATRDSQGDWHKSTIDSSSSYSPGLYNSLALQASDEADVTYSKQNHLWFGRYDHGSWDLSCIFNTSNSGQYNHLVLDPTDDGWYMTHVCDSGDPGYSHLFIQWWAPIKLDNKMVMQQKRVSFSINNIYPLPARDYINCTYSASQAGQINMHLYDLSGKLVSTGSVSNQAGDGTFTYDVSDLATGIYTVRASSAGLVSNKKIIVSR
jgi:hypothetical protein